MREAHERERTVGIAWYVSDAPGIGGRLRSDPTDFRVRELERFDMEPVDADPGAYPCLVIRATLRNWDTNDFARRLSDALGISRERISWAGTKDKHAVTTQLFTIREVSPDALPTIEGAELSVVGRAGRDLTFGDLAGNGFNIRVRDVTPPDDDLAGAVASITDDLEVAGPDPGGDATVVGVPNYFGHQRFGSRRPITHEVGFRLLKDDPRGAVLTYAGRPFDTEPDESQRARQVVEREAASQSPDWASALDAMPGRLRHERGMLHRLAEADAPTGPESAPDAAVWWHALAAVPENLGRLFINAAQSYLFNRIVSRRLERGLPLAAPVAGDVCCFAETISSDDTVGPLALPDPTRSQRVTADRVEIMTRHCERGRAFVTVPLVGTDTELAEGDPGEIERAVLSEVDVSPADFDLRDPYGSTGTRRAALVRTPLSVSRSDGEPVFSFALPSGAYATTLLREYLKTPPSRL